jgi:hypothetical protein
MGKKRGVYHGIRGVLDKHGNSFVIDTNMIVKNLEKFEKICIVFVWFFSWLLWLGLNFGI